MDLTEQQVIDEIDAILAIGEEYDPANPGIDPVWDTLRTPPPPPKPKAIPAPPDCAATEGHRRIPTASHRQGRVIQPSDARNRAKMEWLINPPTPRPRHKKPPPKPEETRPTLEPARVIGPLPAPPIEVQVEPGHTVLVPHFAVHSAREWKTRSGGKRWHIRFNGDGTVRKVREMPPRPY
jgi:hypothetical protein